MISSKHNYESVIFMAAALLKLLVTASAANTTHTVPTAIRYFYTVVASHIVSGTLTIPAASFVDDTNTAISSITTATANDGYYQLYINGQLQEGGLYTVTANNVVVTDATNIDENQIVSLVVNNFAPTTSSVITVNT